MSKSIARRLAIQRGARIDPDAQYRTEEATGPVLAHLAGGLPALEKYCAEHPASYILDMDTFRHSGLSSKPIATVTVPVRTVSELNRHEHWRHRQKRAKAQRAAVLLIAPTKVTFPYRPEPVHVHIVRLAARKLDTDNLASSQKAIRDAIATLLGVDDGNERLVTWSYGQEQQKGYGVRIEFYRRQP